MILDEALKQNPNLLSDQGVPLVSAENNGVSPGDKVEAKARGRGRGKPAPKPPVMSEELQQEIGVMEKHGLNMKILDSRSLKSFLRTPSMPMPQPGSFDFHRRDTRSRPIALQYLARTSNSETVFS